MVNQTCIPRIENLGKVLESMDTLPAEKRNIALWTVENKTADRETMRIKSKKTPYYFADSTLIPIVWGGQEIGVNPHKERTRTGLSLFDTIGYHLEGFRRVKIFSESVMGAIYRNVGYIVWDRIVLVTIDVENMIITIYQQPDDGWITLSNQVRYNKK
ncbi:MAG: hypothetical protein WCF94_04540 [bacterium]